MEKGPLTVVQRRSWLLVPLALLISACCGLGRYHSRVKFSLSTTSPKVGESIQASIDYMDDTDELCEFVLLNGGGEVDRAVLPRGARHVILSAREPGPHHVELRWSDKMIAHTNISVRPP